MVYEYTLFFSKILGKLHAIQKGENFAIFFREIFFFNIPEKKV